MADTKVKNPVVIVGTKAQVESTAMGENDFALATDVEFYNKEEVNGLLGGYATKTDLNTKQNKLSATGSSNRPVYYDGATLKETTRLKAELVSGGLAKEIYYAHHPEMGEMHVIPFIYNDFAFIDKKGGSYTVTRNDGGEVTNPQNIFDAAPSFMLSRGFTKDTIWTVEISTPTSFGYGTILYIDFGSEGFSSAYIKIEAQHSTTGAWQNVLEKTDNTLPYLYCRCSSDDAGVNKFRFTFKSPLGANQFRISSIGAISYKSSGVEETLLTRKGGTVYGDVIAPNITKIQNTLNGKVNIAQGAENAGKILKVDDNGNVVVGEGGGGDYLPLSGGTLTGDISFNDYFSLSGAYFTDGLAIRKYIAGTWTNIYYANSGYFSPVGDDARTLGKKNARWANVYATKLNNGADIAIPTTGGTLARLEDLEGIGGGASLPILMSMWSDHVINDMSWLRADTFSWHDGEKYKAAYNHLLADYEGGREQTDTYGDLIITYYLTEDGHKICTPAQESSLLSLYEQTGVAWYYMIDPTNKQFKLPRTKWGFTGLRDSVGGYVDQDVLLPNITGTITGDLTPRGDAGHGTSGAFTHTDATVYGKGASSNTTYFHSISFNASRSSSVYSGNGTNTLIQPRGTQMYLYFYVGNFEQSAIEQTAGINAEMFNDLNAHKIIEVQNPTAENGYSWYRKYADGWVEQGGRCTGSSGYTIAFMVPFADTNYIAIAGLLYSHAGTICNVGCTNFTTTSMFLSISDNTQGNNRPACWQASGMAA